MRESRIEASVNARITILTIVEETNPTRPNHYVTLNFTTAVVGASQETKLWQDFVSDVFQLQRAQLVERWARIEKVFFLN